MDLTEFGGKQMRIIDSNKDFYDFYQNIYRDDHLVFDRRDSYDLSKEEFCSCFLCEESRRWYHGEKYEKEKDVLLQVCNTFWLLNLAVTATDSYGICTDYKLELQKTWKDYSLKRELILLRHVYFFDWRKKIDPKKKIERISTGDFKTIHTFDRFILSKSHGEKNEKEERHIPILKNIGIAGPISPQDIFFALEEYFSQEKSATERTESVGLTNDEKISNHGFDLKDSFRGK